MVSLHEDGFEMVGVMSSGTQRPLQPPAPRRSTRAKKLPAIPRAASPMEQPEPLGLNADHPSKRIVANPVKRKRSAGDTSPSTRGRSHGRGRGRSAAAADDDDDDELEEGPYRKYKKSSPEASKKFKASPSKAKGKGTAKDNKKAEEKQAKPKKPTKAAMERAKLEELRSDPHFGKLDDASIKRIAKVHLERMYLIHRFRNGDQYREEFDISGSKGNVYKVVLDRNASCSCMDFSLRRQVCKHMLFVYIKVLRLGGHLPVYTSVRLTQDQVEEAFDEALANPVAQALAKPELRKAWETAVGYQPDNDDTAASASIEPAEPEGKRLIPEEGDVCGVCYEDLEPGSVEGLEFCLESCGRPIHTDCLETWFNTRGFNRTCIWCRAKWHEPGRGNSADINRKTNGYGIGLSARGAVVDANGRQLNLAAAAGLNDPVVPEPAVEAGGAQADGTPDATGWE